MLLGGKGAGSPETIGLARWVPASDDAVPSACEERDDDGWRDDNTVWRLQAKDLRQERDGQCAYKNDHRQRAHTPENVVTYVKQPCCRTRCVRKGQNQVA